MAYVMKEDEKEVPVFLKRAFKKGNKFYRKQLPKNYKYLVIGLDRIIILPLHTNLLKLSQEKTTFNSLKDGFFL